MSSKFAQTTAKATTAYEAMRAAGADFTVRLEDVQAVNPEWRSDENPIPWRAMLKDDGTFFAMVGSRYAVIQPEQVGAIADAAAGEGATFDNVAVWNDGRTIAFQMGLPGGGADIGGSTVVPALTILAGYDGKTALQTMLTTTNLNCSNQFVMCRREAGHALLRVTHTSSAPQRLLIAAGMMREAAANWDQFRGRANALAHRAMTNAEQVAFVANALGGDRDAKDARIRNRYEVALAAIRWERENATGNPDTAWVAFNAVTNATNHADGVARAKPGTGRRAEAVTRGRLAKVNVAAFAALTR